jgi:hypothetical protein
MGNPLSPVLANIFMAKLESDVIKPLNLPFYVRYVDDCFTTRPKNAPDTTLKKLNAYHDNINFTVEESPDRFLDTSFQVKGGRFITKVHNKKGKLPTHWSSQTPTKWKHNCIMGDLHRASRISSNFNNEVHKIKQKYEEAGYPRKVILTAIKSFQAKNKNNNNANDSRASQENIKKMYIRLPYCTKNEALAKKFIRSLRRYTGNKFVFIILWQTKKIRSIFKIKDRNKHISNVVYKGNCICGENYIGETLRNLEVRIAEHEDTSHNSEPARHIRENPNHTFHWSVLFKSQRDKQRKIMEAFYIKQLNPPLNKQCKHYSVLLFPEGIT